MMADRSGRQLIDDLLADPQAFVAQGQAYNLLQAYFAGLPLDSLRPLLRSSDPWVQRASSFVASELGTGATTLIADVIPLLSSTDLYTQNHAMEVLAVCSEGDAAGLFALVAEKVESDARGIRLQAMDLVARAAPAQLRAAADYFRSSAGSGDVREHILQNLAEGVGLDSPGLTAMLEAPDPVTRRYAAIAIKRLARNDSRIVRTTESVESELREFLATQAP